MRPTDAGVIHRVERGEFSRAGSNLEELFGRMGVARGDEELPFLSQKSEGADDFEPIRVRHRFARGAFDVDGEKAPCGTLVRERVDETPVPHAAKGLETRSSSDGEPFRRALPSRETTHTVVADPVRLPVHGDEGDTPSVGSNARSAIEPRPAYRSRSAFVSRSSIFRSE